MRRRSSRGSTLMEMAMWVPVLVLLLVGTVELARVSFTYYAVHKILYSVARLAGTRQGVNFCDDADTGILAAKNLALRGAPDESVEPLIQGLEPEMIEVRIERFNPSTEQLEQCECSESGCDAAAGGLSPDYVVVRIPDGFPVRLIIPGLPQDPILLRPVIRVPYGGT